MIALSANAQEELLKRFGIEEITPEMRALISAVLKHRYEVKGKVMGTDDFEPTPYPLQGANITLTCVADTTQFGGAAADQDGHHFRASRNGREGRRYDPPRRMGI